MENAFTEDWSEGVNSKGISRNQQALSLFSGCGGMDVGIRNAGFDVRACIEIDPNCCDTLRHNASAAHHDTVVMETDIRRVDPYTLMLALGLREGELDLLFGGSPCQSFSQIGKKGALSDERGQLLFESVRFAKALKPRVVLLEQVKGLLTAKDDAGAKGGVFSRLSAELSGLGYVVKHAVLTASDYGVAQNRERVFMVGVMNDGAFDFPAATHSGHQLQGGPEGLQPYVTVGDVLAGMKDPVVRESGVQVPDDGHYDVTPPRDRERIHYVPEGEYLAKQRNLPSEILGRLQPRDTTKFLRVSRSRPANTLRGGEIFFHPVADRYLTPREYMRIHSYPDSYELRGPIRGRSGSAKTLDQHRQVANSVPPLLAEKVGRSISEVLKCR